MHRKYEEAEGELLSLLKCGPHSTKTLATPNISICCPGKVAQSRVLRKLQFKLVSPTMVQCCSGGLIGEGVFGTCFKAFFQGMLVCVKQLKDPSSRALLHEAEVLNQQYHPSVCWLLALQIQSAPFQLVMPYYAVKGHNISYYDILFDKNMNSLCNTCQSIKIGCN